VAAHSCNAPNGHAIIFPCSFGYAPAPAELPLKINIFERDIGITLGEKQAWYVVVVNERDRSIVTRAHHAG
jgi:hypothetical protein